MPPRCSANKETTEKAAAFPEEAMPQHAPRKGKERQVATGATSRTAKPKRHKRVALLVISFITIIPLSAMILSSPKTTRMMTPMKWLTLCLNLSPLCVLGTQEIPALQLLGFLTSHISLSCIERTRRCRSGSAKYVGTSSSVQYAMDSFVNGILARNMVSRRF